MIPTLRAAFENGHASLGGAINFSNRTYESNLPYVLRFMVDKDITGCGWVTLPAGKYRLEENKSRYISRSQIEVNIDQKDIIGRDCNNDPMWGKIAPYRILSLDIECVAQIGFPTPDRDQVITIACYGKPHGKSNEIKIVFQLDGCDTIVGTDLRTFKYERDLLMAFSEFFIEYDPDVITGYNVITFDLHYLIKRAEKLKIPAFTWGRLKNVKTVMKEGRYLAKAMGMRTTVDINLDGRIQLDMMIHMMKEKKLSSYTLNAVSYQFLGEQKEDVQYSIIKDLQNGDDHSRKRIATYCLKDAILP